MPTTITENEPGKVTFLSLPPELRHTIYTLATPPRRLSTTQFIDGAHSPEPQTIPALFLVSRKVNAEASSIFYSNATLELPVPQLSSTLQAWATGHVQLEDQTAAQRRHMSLAFLPSRFRFLLRRAHLFNNEAGCYPTPVAYEALLAWLARNTSITDVCISKALMFRACKRRSMLESEASALLDLLFSGPSLPFRTLKVFSQNDREFWEGRGMGAGRGTIVSEQAPSLRMYICITASTSTTLICDPRGTAQHKAGEAETRAGELMDSLRARDRSLSDEVVQQVSEDGRWLFQVIFVI